VGAGIDYGYSLTVAPRWNIEFTVGVGVAYMNYKSFDCTLCSGVLDTHEKPYFGPTNIGVNLVFLIK
jgi:hypothetical protein